MKSYIQFYYSNFLCIIYNLISIFFIITNMFIPLYSDEILYYNSNIITDIYINYKIDSNIIRNDFINFMNSIIKKNEEFITNNNNFKKEQLNLENFIIDNTYTDSDSDSESDLDVNINNKSNDIIPSLVNLIDNKKNSNSDNFIFEH
jgi:hypothetical protein|uniref:Uncharacterized protein n=1 Tax=viral metagenome TaxID=1070528 RepID=A0A6C0JP72_9ZZZZ